MVSSRSNRMARGRAMASSGSFAYICPPWPTTRRPPLTGAALIKDQVRRLPDAPGVYRMFGEDGEALYVGKARSLKKRVVQYAQGRFHTQRIALMVDLTRSMEFTTTRTETDALLLEINLIKQLKPRFNVLLRDDKSFPEIVIRREHPAAQLRKHRGAHSIKGDYFGPFASAWAVNRTLNTLQKAFLLRSCSDSVYESRTRPCMLHQIRRCSAPCTGLISLGGLPGPGARGRGLPARQEPGGDGADVGRDAGRLRRPGVRARRAPARPHPRPVVHRPGDPDQSRDGRRGRRLRPARRGRPGLRPGVLLPRRPELGQPRLLPPRRQERRGRRDHGRLPGPVLRGQADPAA